MVSVAIIGAGPSGCYTAQALLKVLPDAQIDIFDRLPVPYGLVRYGVAPDHQGTKAVIRQFERLFERQGVGFFGNVTLGEDVALADLQAAYDVVVLAVGLCGDRRLGIAGEDLAGVIGSGVMTRYLNDHPDAEGHVPQIGRDVVIVGHGNVAIDLVRLLVKRDEEFHGSDLSAQSQRVVQDAGPRKITVIGRSPADAARFDPVMLRELGRLEDARLQVIAATGEGKVIDALAAIQGHAPNGARHDVCFRFGWTPQRLLGDQRVTAVEFVATGGVETLTLPCDTVLTAIGFDAGDGLVPMAADDDGFIAPGLYATGWFRRGPRGTIPENRADAQTVAARIADDLGRSPPSGRPGRAAALALFPSAIGFAGWQCIDLAERDQCPPDRCRTKIASRQQMIAIAQSAGATS
jgi:ferredoxin--NADP+ reductase